MKLPKIITDPSCGGCQKRKEWLKGAARKTKKFMARTVVSGSNAARRVISTPVRRNSPELGGLPQRPEGDGKLTHGGTER